MNHLSILQGSCACIRTTLLNITLAQEEGYEYDANVGWLASGHNVVLKDDTPEAAIICNALERSLSTTHAVLIVNLYRADQEPPEPPVSWSAVEAFSLQSPVILKQHRQTKKSGKDSSAEVHQHKNASNPP